MSLSLSLLASLPSLSFSLSLSLRSLSFTPCPSLIFFSFSLLPSLPLPPFLSLFSLLPPSPALSFLFLHSLSFPPSLYPSHSFSFSLSFLSFLSSLSFSLSLSLSYPVSPSSCQRKWIKEDKNKCWVHWSQWHITNDSAAAKLQQSQWLHTHSRAIMNSYNSTPAFS